MQIKDYNLPKESFIGGWIISDKICDGLLSYYKKHSDHVLSGVVSDNKIVKKIKGKGRRLEKSPLSKK